MPGGKMKAVFGLSRTLSFFKGKSVSETVNAMKKLGVNAVFGVHEDRELSQALQKAGIRVYAEIGLFSGPERWEEHPEARPITAAGIPIEKDKWYGGLCPNQEWLRKEKLDLVRKLAEECDVDGVWLDFIRYSCHWEVKEPRIEQNCFCPVCLKLFQEESGIAIPGEIGNVKAKAEWILANHRDRWTSFKCRRIEGFVEACRAVLKKSKPRAVLGIFGVPWVESDYGNAIQEVIAQDYAALGKSADVFSPMCYHRMCGRDVKWISAVTKEIYRKTGKPCAPIIQAAEVPKEEFVQALESALADPSSGVIVFNMRNLKGDLLDAFAACRLK